MSTRSVIARTEDQGTTFRGTYHHWDGYPEGLGVTLLAELHDKFGGQVNKLLEHAIDQHPRGWSSYPEKAFQDGSDHALTQEDASACGCEWCYAFDDCHMYVLKSYCGDAMPDECKGAPMVGMFGTGDASAVWRVVHVVCLRGLSDEDALAAMKIAQQAVYA